MRAALFASLLLAGCYDPRPSSGAYLCGTPNTDGGTGSCPDNQLCECGQCVDKKGEAACSFKVTVLGTTDGSLTVKEHEPFKIQIDAITSTSAAASAFDGKVAVSSTWGDVCIGDNGCLSQNATVQLSGGTAQALIQLNRETIPPQTAIVSASFAGNVGTSGSARISVTAPMFSTYTTIQTPLNGTQDSFGFAKGFVGAPFVVKASTGWNMYFYGADGASTAIGVATSMDGVTFAPSMTPLYTDPSNQTGTATAVLSGDDATLLFGTSRQSASAFSAGFLEIASLTGPQTSGPYMGAPVPVLSSTTCPFCKALDTPSIIADPDPALSGGTPSATIMYFTALPNQEDTTSLTVGRATSPDGKTYTIDPSALLKATTTENAIYSPRVLVDGTTYKMWYSVTSYGNKADAAPPSPCEVDGDFNDLKGDVFPVTPSVANVYSVGYATSSDGLFWVRSPNNVSTPVFVFGAAEPYESVFIGSVVPVDGHDPSSGIAIYFNTFSNPSGMVCYPDGIYRTQSE